jgi:hypothetical protein
MLERHVEKRLVDMCRKHGIIAYKFTSPGHAHVPDRLLLLPDGKGMLFVEVKSPTGRVREAQQITFDRIRSQGYRVDVVHDYEQIDTLLAELTA